MLSILDKSTTIPNWREAPAVQKVVAEIEAESGEDVAGTLHQAVLDASRHLAEVEARESHQRATRADVAAAKAALVAAETAVREHADRYGRQAERLAASRTIAAEIILAAQRDTAQRVAERGAASAKRLLPIIRRALEEIETLHDAHQLERDYFGDILGGRLDPIGNQVLPIGCYLEPGHQLHISFAAGSGRDAVIWMRDWLRRMEERGYK